MEQKKSVKHLICSLQQARIGNHRCIITLYPDVEETTKQYTADVVLTLLEIIQFTFKLCHNNNNNNYNINNNNNNSNSNNNNNNNNNNRNNNIKNTYNNNNSNKNNDSNNERVFNNTANFEVDKKTSLTVLHCSQNKQSFSLNDNNVNSNNQKKNQDSNDPFLWQKQIEFVQYQNVSKRCVGKSYDLCIFDNIAKLNPEVLWSVCGSIRGGGIIVFLHRKESTRVTRLIFDCLNNNNNSSNNSNSNSIDNTTTSSSSNENVTTKVADSDSIINDSTAPPSPFLFIQSLDTIKGAKRQLEQQLLVEVVNQVVLDIDNNNTLKTHNSNDNLCHNHLNSNNSNNSRGIDDHYY
eukprot:Awhi_evm1s12672